METAELAIVMFTLLMLCGSIGVLYRMHTAWRKAFERETERNRLVDECLKELQMLSSSYLGIGKRIDRLSREVSVMKEQLDGLGNQPATGIPYEQVARMAEDGSDVDGIMRVFGISEAEASLVVKLHGEQSAG